MSEEVTPAEQQVPAATPPAPTVDTVSLSKEEHAQLVRNAARAAEAQSRADRLEKMLSKRGNHFNGQPAPQQPVQEDLDSKAAAEDYKAERALLALAADPVFRDVLDADPTLRDILVKNPLAVLPILAPDALDAEDAINLVKESLSKRKPAPKETPATPPAPAPVIPPAPPAGGVNPQDKPTDAEYESAKSHKNTENAIAGMVKAGMRRMKGGA